EMRSGTRKTNRQTQLEEPQPVVSRHSTQFLGGLSVEGRFGIDQNLEQARIVRRVNRVERELNAIGDKVFELRVNGIIDAAETSDRLAFTRHLGRQACGTICADSSLGLENIDLGARLFDPINFVRSGNALIDGCQNCVQVAQAAPIAQMLFVITRAQTAGMIDGKFERHAYLLVVIDDFDYRG